MAASALKLFFTCFLLLLFAVLFSFGIRHEPWWSMYAVSGLSLCGMFSVIARAPLGMFFLGFVLCIGSVLGPSALDVILCAWLFGYNVNLFRVRCAGGLIPAPGVRELWLSSVILLVPFGIGLFHTLWHFTSSKMLLDSLRLGGAPSALEFLRATYWGWFQGPELLMGFTLAVMLMMAVVGAQRSFFSRDESAVFRFILYGLSCGVMTSAFYTVLQIAEIHPFFSASRGAYWEKISRYPGTFFDPNALGIMGLLLLPIFISASRRRGQKFYIEALVFFALMPWSGSRTFVLGLAFWLLVLCIRGVALSRYRFTRLIFTANILAFVGLLTLLSTPAINSKVREVISAPAFSRAIETISLERAETMFKSRELFLRVGLQMWRENPWSGVGLGRFQTELPGSAEEIGINFGPWRDNANNFYLHVLAELGVLGFLLVVIGMVLIAWQVTGSSAQKIKTSWKGGDEFKLAHVIFALKTTLIIFVLLLFTGPHLFFPEVRFLIAIIIAWLFLFVEKVNPVPLLRYKKLVLGSVAVLSLLMLSDIALKETGAVPDGVYAEEVSSTGTVRWTGSVARFQICSRLNEAITLRIQSSHPDLSTTPLKVRITRRNVGKLGSKVVKDVEFRETGWNKIVLDVPEGDAPQSQEIIIEVPRLWSPHEVSKSNDRRWLGVMLKWPKNVCR